MRCCDLGLCCFRALLQKHADLLANEPWQIHEDPDDSIWLFVRILELVSISCVDSPLRRRSIAISRQKFHVSSDAGCCFLITDTVHVWGEGKQRVFVVILYIFPGLTPLFLHSP